MANELPVRHLQRLIELGKSSEGPAARISANVVEGWIESLNGEDPVAVLNGVMSALGHLPSCPEDFLGDELYSRVERVRDNVEDDEDEEDDGSDFEDEDEDEE